MIGRVIVTVLLWLGLSASLFALVGALPEPPPEAPGAPPSLHASTPGRRLACFVWGGPDCGPSRGLVRGALGWSSSHRAPVWDVIGGPIASTLALMAPVLLIASLTALLVGVLASSLGKWGARIDTLCLLVSSAPLHWIGLVLLWVFAIELRLTSVGPRDPFASASPSSGLSQWTLPAAAAIIFYTARWSRFVRSRAREVRASPAMAFARSLGLSEAALVWRHVVPGAAAPLLAVLGQTLPVLASGLVVLESLFSYPGMGRTIYAALIERDYELAVLAFSLYAAATYCATAVVDAVHARLDPRIAVR